MEKGPNGFIQCPHCNCKYKTDVKYQKHLSDKHANCSATVALNSIAAAAMLSIVNLAPANQTHALYAVKKFKTW